MDDLDLLVAEMIARPIERSLRTYPLADPLPAQRRLFDQALGLARASGLRLPTRFTVRWVGVPRGSATHNGETTREADGSIEMILNLNVWPNDLVPLVLHELQHVADFDNPRLRGLSRLEHERRAIAFTAKAMGWR